MSGSHMSSHQKPWPVPYEQVKYWREGRWGPRASISLVRMAQAMAFFDGMTYVTPTHVYNLAVPYFLIQKKVLIMIESHHGIT